MPGIVSEKSKEREDAAQLLRLEDGAAKTTVEHCNTMAALITEGLFPEFLRGTLSLHQRLWMRGGSPTQVKFHPSQAALGRHGQVSGFEVCSVAIPFEMDEPVMVLIASTLLPLARLS